MNWRDHIQADPKILAGKPALKGTRLSVQHIMGRLADGWTVDMLKENYPNLTDEHIQAVFAFASESLEDGFAYIELARKSA